MTDYRLVYYSANRLNGTAEQKEADIDTILARSRRNNDSVGVTGALTFSDGYFAQVLEGPQGAVEVTFERIQQDGRHSDVHLLEFVPIADRTFSNWSMAYVGKAVEGSKLAGLGATTGFDPAKISGQQLFERLRDLLLAEQAVA
ncbi:MAG: blue light sensor protein [Devosia sp.]|jgi:hypothetical protein|nr:blue light sensor protein [Devosia sp.]